MNYHEEKKYTGHRDQLLKVRKVQCEEGKAKGCDLLEVLNSQGLAFDVNISRGMDISYLSYQGKSIGYQSASGIVAPEYFDNQGLEFLKSFTVGFLTTCGLQMIGAPNEYQGKQYGLHGNISNTPASNFSYEILEENTLGIEIEGKMEEAVIFGDKLSLKRKIACDYTGRTITLEDTVRNEGYNKARHMILYHCNLGYPLLTPSSEVYIPSSKVVPRDEHAAQGLHQWMKMEEAQADYQEMCYYHTLIPDERGYATVAVYQPELNMGISIEIDLHTLDHFIQWKMMGAKDYVCGLEPANATIDGIQDAIDNGSMKYLNPQEEVTYHLKFTILNDQEEFQALKREG